MAYSQVESAFLRILEQAGPQGVSLTIVDLANSIGCSRDTLCRVKSRLESTGKITVERSRCDGKRAVNRYELARKGDER